MNTGNTHPIRSERLELISLTPAFLEASLAGDLETAAGLINLQIHPDWLQAKQLMQIRLDQLRRLPTSQPWLLRAVGLRQEKIMVGHIGFHTQPGPTYLQDLAPGGVELGYTIYAPFRRQGYAREACAALMEWAYRKHNVTRFVVSINPDNMPSLRIAQHFGFKKVSEHYDDRDGLEHVFVRYMGDGALC
jgi:RimJ/RimL family protein N-acetyltransferase